MHKNLVDGKINDYMQEEAKIINRIQTTKIDTSEQFTPESFTSPNKKRPASVISKDSGKKMVSGMMENKYRGSLVK
jgi:hypothetical protein